MQLALACALVDFARGADCIFQPNLDWADGKNNQPHPSAKDDAKCCALCTAAPNGTCQVAVWTASGGGYCSHIPTLASLSSPGVTPTTHSQHTRLSPSAIYARVLAFLLSHPQHTLPMPFTLTRVLTPAWTRGRGPRPSRTDTPGVLMSSPCRPFAVPPKGARAGSRKVLILNQGRPTACRPAGQRGTQCHPHPRVQAHPTPGCRREGYQVCLRW